jgi:hypothetical protein
MGSGMKKSYRVNFFCSILVAVFLVSVPVFTAVSSKGAVTRVAGAGSSINDPLHRLPSSPEEAHRQLQERKAGWPGDAGAGGRSIGSVQQGVRVSLADDTVTGLTTHAGRAVKVERIRGADVQVVNTTTNAQKLFTADMAAFGIRSGDTVRVTDMVSGGPVNVNCTLTGAISTATDVVSGTAVSGNTIDVYIASPSTYFGDVPPGAARKSTTAAGGNWTASFGVVLNLLGGDTAYIYSTDTSGNIVMDVANTGGSLVVYPQYNDIMGYYQAGRLLQVSAGSASQDVGTSRDGFFEAWFVTHDIVPGEVVS